MKVYRKEKMVDTFATRCIEGGMKPKTLQIILGHTKVETTLNTYVHVTKEYERTEIDNVQDYLNGVKMVSNI